MRLLKSCAGTCIAGALLLSSTCPTQDDFFPPPLEAPVFADITAGAVRQGGRYHPSLCMTWSPPAQDSNQVDYYSILRNAVNFSDTLFSIARHSIPGSITSYCDRIDQFGFPKESIKKISYRICTLDTAGQSGDTSQTDTFFLAVPPRLRRPAIDDTLTENYFEWSMRGVFGQYRTFMLFWNSSGLLWQSTPDSTYGNEKNDVFTAALPDSLYNSLTGDTCFWGVKIEALSLPYQESIDIRSVYVSK
ncbi:MAG: hypothetical protein GF401_06475 [Chitinivibrionales bacterium]|nr:hypothetical protein [Chitinivibrionales bacterium]